MSETFQCGDNSALVGYLYDECEPAEREVIDAHVSMCAACAAEIAALQSARVQLSFWTPPDTDLGFAVVRPQPSAVSRPPLSETKVQASRGRPRKAAARGWRAWSEAWRQPPVWVQAAAACLIFGVGLSLGVLRGTLPPTSSNAPTMAAASVNTPAVTATDLAALERRLRAEMAALRAAPAISTSAPQSGSNGQLLAQVRALIDESEQRQQRELALRTAQVVRDFDSQRQVDLAQIQRNLGQIEGLTGAEVREQRQMLNYLMRVSEQR